MKEKINEYAPLHTIGKIESNMEKFSTSDELREFIRQIDVKIDTLESKLT